MFKKILIANRGEIAVRVIVPAVNLESGQLQFIQKLIGIHFTLSWQMKLYALVLAASQSSYLDIPNIISAAVQCQADAVHPGMGIE